MERTSSSLRVAAVDVVAAGAACRVGVRVCVSCCAVCCGLRASAVVWAPAIPGSPCRVGRGRRGRVAVARARCPRVQVWGCLSLSTKSHRASRTHAGLWAYAAGHATTRPAEPRASHDRGSDRPPPDTPSDGQTRSRRLTASAASSRHDSIDYMIIYFRYFISYFVALGTHVRCGCLSLSAARGTQLRSLRSPQRDTSLGRVLSSTSSRRRPSTSLFHTVCFTPSSDPHARAEGEWTALLAGTGSG